ncbi:MAG: MogA/MoaB family molybdenum cofactor biosynthesis protein [Ruminococcaceae bacterium]|nr:MogA/MoaB family molybdenum cofactor biosynthesis protein [Oscillospiraceae bacterium]MBQ9912727.1 MogA/MoaB family molybdenum cofactor biosynthesis protein [Clostridia bacterium]
MIYYISVKKIFQVGSDKKVNFAVLCVSDRCSKGLCEDKSGPLISELVACCGSTKEYLIVPDEKSEIEKALIYLCDEIKADVVFTTGGTGFAPRDVTPEATKAVIEREAPGIAEGIRQKSMEITPKAMLSRAASGIRKGSLIINLPGSPKAVKESLQFVLPVLPHAVEVLSGNTLNCGGSYGKVGD